MAGTVVLVARTPPDEDTFATNAALDAAKTELEQAIDAIELESGVIITNTDVGLEITHDPFTDGRILRRDLEDEDSTTVVKIDLTDLPLDEEVRLKLIMNHRESNTDVEIRIIDDELEYSLPESAWGDVSPSSRAFSVEADVWDGVLLTARRDSEGNDGDIALAAGMWPKGAGLPVLLTALVRDDFEAEDDANINGRSPEPVNIPEATWSVHRGTCLIDDNNAVHTSGANMEASVDVDTNTCRIATVTQSGSGANWGLIGWAIDHNDHWFVSLRESNNDVRIVERVEGNATTRATASLTINEGQPYKVEMVFSATGIEVLVDDVSIVSHEVTALSRNRFGLRSSAVGSRFEYFEVKPL